MFILQQSINIYSTKLITDMVGRYAETEDSVCPMYGFLKRLQELWHINETTADVRALFEEQPDFDADKATPTIFIEDLEGREDADIRIIDQENLVEKRYDPYRDTTDFDGYVRHLEDLPEAYMDKYLENITFRVRRQNNGVAAYNMKHPTQMNFMGVGDNGFEITERVDLVSDYTIDRDELRNTELAMQQLAFVVKRLHNLSRICRIHILSFISSYVKAKKESDAARANGTSTSQFKLNDVIRVGVWKCNENGDVTGMVTLGDKNKSAPVVFQWACGFQTVFSSYYEDMSNYLMYCETLSIDILSENMCRYGSEFANSLFVSIVTPNTQYDKLVADALKFYGVENTQPNNTLIEDDFEKTLAEVVAYYQAYYYNRSDEYLRYMRQGAKERNYIFTIAVDLMQYQNALYRIGYRPKSAFSWVDGLLYMDNELCTFVTNLIDPNFSGKDSYCVLSDTGYMLRVEPGYCVTRVMMNSLADHIQRLRNGSNKAPSWEVI